MVILSISPSVISTNNLAADLFCFSTIQSSSVIVCSSNDFAITLENFSNIASVGRYAWYRKLDSFCFDGKSTSLGLLFQISAPKNISVTQKGILRSFSANFLETIAKEVLLVKSTVFKSPIEKDGIKLFLIDI